VGVATVEAHLLRTVRTAAQARLRTGRRLTRGGPAVAALPYASKPSTPAGLLAARRADRVLAIGCSTGGPKALMEVLPRLPANLPAAVLVVQHMPAGFTRSLAERLNDASALTVKEAEDGDTPVAGLVLLAPGGRHMALDAGGRVVLRDDPPVHGVRPSVDVLFNTLPAIFGRRCVAAVLTGMGSDGADGAAAIKAAGGRVAIEDESTCVVYGMPRAVAERGLADRSAPLDGIAASVTDLVLNERAV
jgi:two-component system chemotaxis response regulator CheB